MQNELCDWGDVWEGSVGSEMEGYETGTDMFKCEMRVSCSSMWKGSVQVPDIVSVGG